MVFIFKADDVSERLVLIAYPYQERVSAPERMTRRSDFLGATQPSVLRAHLLDRVISWEFQPSHVDFPNPPCFLHDTHSDSLHFAIDAILKWFRNIHVAFGK